MFKVEKYPHGTFSWVDCASTDTSKNKQFYADLMGWKIEDIPMSETEFYTMYKLDGENAAALSPMHDDMKNSGIPSHWNSYITVDDVDALEDKITELGGKVVMGPFDVFDNGRMIILQDPTGAMVNLWQPKNHIGASVVNKPGAFTWNELATREPQKAIQFYSDLLGWTSMAQDGRDDYWMVMNNGRVNGGVIAMDDSWGDMPPVWTVYFSVADLDKTIEKAKSLGGSVMMDATDAGEIGRFAILNDPIGAGFQVIELSNPDTWTE